MPGFEPTSHAAPAGNTTLGIMHVRLARWITLVALCVAGGCSTSSEGPDYLRVAVADYPAAFDAAVESARLEGLSASLRDRRGGVIETLPQVAGSVLEPWRTDNASLDQGLENTIAYQRRRARFEFAPVGSISPADDSRGSSLSGPDHLSAGATHDLTQAVGDLEVRVWVYIERAHIPGMQRSTWTRSKTSQAVLVYPEGVTTRRGVTVLWTPVARDLAYERRLLGRVQQLMSGSLDGAKNEPPLVSSELFSREPE